MKRIIQLIITIIILLTITSLSQAAILNVPTDYSTIQNAIIAANDGDIILVSPGTYYPGEDIVIPEGVKLSGDHWSTCTIGLGGLFRIQLDNNTILEGFKIITPPDGRDIILALNINSFSITNNVIQGSQDAEDWIAAISIDNSSGNIENNVIDGGHTGIHVEIANDSIIINNIIINTVYSLLNINGGIFILDYNAFWENVSTSNITGTNNISADPEFMDIENDDYSLCPDLSPCIDAGHPDATYNDVDDTRNDIGVNGGQEGISLDTRENCAINGEDIDDPEEIDLADYITQDGYHCFIATAAYGTPMAQQVKILCRFRDKYLLTNAPGRKFVAFYYKYSPPIAEYIAKREWLRKMIRIILWPFVELG